jgi:patatin-like phospholipase/acyl hydrolase
MATPKNYRILTLDGGGIRGVLTITILKRLQQAHATFLENVDLVAGTSTGGILALAIAAGRNLDVALKLYKEKGRLVFADSPMDDLKDMGNAFGAEYSNTGLKQALEEEFKDMTLGELKKKVVIVSFDLDNKSLDFSVTRTWKPKIFHNYPGKGSDEKELVVDVALRTAAAPTFFPVYQGYIDGGVVANNPSMCALAQALDKKTGGQSLSKIALLSLSTGGYPRYLTTEDADWGWTQWARPLVDIMLEGNVGVADYQCERVLKPGRYCRIAPRLIDPISLDSLDKIPELETAGQKFDLDESIKFVQKFF